VEIWKDRFHQMEQRRNEVTLNLSTTQSLVKVPSSGPLRDVDHLNHIIASLRE
jgi:hypothetical protein